MFRVPEATGKIACLLMPNVREGDDVVAIATTDIDNTIYSALLSAAASIRDTEIISAMITPRKWFGQPPPQQIIKLVEGADVVIAATSTSLAPTDALRKTVQAGGRWINFSGLSLEMLSKPSVMVDQAELKKSCVKWANALHGKTVRITSDRGTDLTVSIDERKAFPCYHIADKESYYQAPIPGGEAMVAAVEDSAEGVAVIESSLSGIRNLRGKVILRFRRGRLTEIEGEEGARFRHILEMVDDNAKVLCEVGIGANPRAEITGSIGEDKRVLGTMHIALGDNLFIVPELYGKNASNAHLDCLILEPTLSIDGVKLIEKGKTLI